jgi:hypothetical protein
MPAIENYDCDGTLAISGVNMNWDAWAIVGDDNGRGGLLNLWIEAEQRGEDRVLPNATGVIPYRRRLDVTPHELRLLVTGDIDLAGQPSTNSKTQLLTNLAFLYTNVIAPTGTGDGTRGATLTFPGMTNRTANIHVLKLEPERYNYVDGSAIFEGTLLISIPAGRFA